MIKWRSSWIFRYKQTGDGEPVRHGGCQASSRRGKSDMITISETGEKPDLTVQLKRVWDVKILVSPVVTNHHFCTFHYYVLLLIHSFWLVIGKATDKQYMWM